MSYSSCHLCPRDCGVNRTAGELGFCGQTAQCRIATMLSHKGEEPPIAGTCGSGTIFFSGCSCQCFFCQNHQISSEGIGKDYTDDQLYDAANELIARGVHNLNFVSPEHWWPTIRTLCKRLREDGQYLPFVWNSSGYFRLDVLKEQSELIDIFLPDFKYADPDLAEQCMGDRRYPELAIQGLKFLYDRIGNLRPFDYSGDITASRGLMIRHLVLPGFVNNSIQVLKTIANTLGTDIPIAVMSQFIPVPECQKRQFLTRKVTPDEYAQVCETIDKLGFTHVFTQEDNGEDGFMPDFTQPNPFAANRP